MITDVKPIRFINVLEKIIFFFYSFFIYLLNDLGWPFHIFFYPPLDMQPERNSISKAIPKYYSHAPNDIVNFSRKKKNANSLANMIKPNNVF